MLHNDLLVDLKNLKKNSLYRYRKSIKGAENQKINIDGRWVFNFSSNDYLGLTKNKNIKKIIEVGIKRFGNGSGGSHLISGHYQIHDDLEKLAAINLGFDKSLLFSSGFLANMAVVTSLCNKSDIIFSDKLNHSSLNEASLLSRAKFFRYHHQDIEHLESLLKKYNGRRKLIITDGVFSMDGDIAKIPDLITLCEKYDAYLYIDDAHGYGVLGKTGQGVIEYYFEKSNLTKRKKSRLIYMFTLGKSVGLSGAIVAANKEIINYIIQKGKSYIYTTAIPPALTAGAIKSLDIIRKEVSLREGLFKSINLLRSKISNKDLLGKSITPIQPIMINDTKKTIKLADDLLKNGFYVPAIRPPTVPINKSRLRISISSLHKPEEIEELASMINYLSK